MSILFFRYLAGSAVNPKRHTSCQVPSNPQAFDIRLHSPRRPTSRTSLPVSFGKSHTGFRDLTPGEQRYFASISKVYLNTQMVRLKRRQYIDILNQELNKGKQYVLLSLVLVSLSFPEHFL